MKNLSVIKKAEKSMDWVNGLVTVSKPNGKLIFSLTLSTQSGYRLLKSSFYKCIGPATLQSLMPVMVTSRYQLTARAQICSPLPLASIQSLQI